MSELEQLMQDAAGADPLVSARRFASQFAGLLVCCERVSQIESLERAAKEAEDRLTKVRSEMQTMQDQRAELATQIRSQIDDELAARRSEVEAAVRQTEALRKT